MLSVVRTSLPVVEALLLCLACSAPHAAFAQVTTAEEEKLLVPWNEMNLQFRDAYARARQNKIDKLGPLIVFREDKMILHYRGNREEVNIISPRYSFLKSVAHIPLTVFMVLNGKTNSRIDDETREVLSAFQAAVEKAAANVDDWKLSRQSSVRQKSMIDGSLKLIDGALETGIVTEDALLEFCRAMAPLTLENAYDAVSLELGSIDSQLERWRSTIDPADWKRLRIAILSPHMPRDENRVAQYFLRLLHEKKEGERIVYGEGRSDEEYGAELTGTHILDKDIAIYFFKDPWRMHRDLLADGAKRYLKKHTPMKR